MSWSRTGLRLTGLPRWRLDHSHWAQSDFSPTQALKTRHLSSPAFRLTARAQHERVMVDAWEHPSGGRPAGRRRTAPSTSLQQRQGERSHGLQRSGASSHGCQRPPAHRVYMSTCWTEDIFWLSEHETDPELSRQSSLIAQSPPAAH